jgi:chaperone modulatory protein CbpM
MKNITITIINDDHLLSLEEITRAVNAESSLITQLIEYHIIEPKGASENEWVFDALALKRARLARNFYYDLEVNIAGIGLLIDLLEKIEHLELQIEKAR